MFKVIGDLISACCEYKLFAILERMKGKREGTREGERKEERKGRKIVGSSDDA